MLGSHGLYGHIRSNAMKSAALLSGFVVLICVSWYAWCLVYASIVYGWLMNTGRGRHHRTVDLDLDLVLSILDKALDIALDRWWVPLLLSALWFWVAYMVHADMIRLATGARPVTRKEQPKLYNMVETLAITAGLPMPRVEVINSGALNAYAAGLSQNDAVVAVTRGLLKALTDDELQAVLAHEMTHIKNTDVRLMVVASCFAGGLTLLGDGIARMFFPPQDDYDSLNYSHQWDADRNPGAGRRAAAAQGLLEAEAATPIAVLISLAIAVLFFAMAHLGALLIPMAISRAREFMADAGATELTKNPDALISALNKISGHDEIAGLNSTVKAMMISASVATLFATHPPIEDRILALEQYAGGRLMAPSRRVATAIEADAGGFAAPAAALGFAAARPTFGKRRPARA